jgi:hypothetical protein
MFSERALERFRAKWIPVRVKKTRRRTDVLRTHSRPRKSAPCGNIPRKPCAKKLWAKADADFIEKPGEKQELEKTKPGISETPRFFRSCEWKKSVAAQTGGAFRRRLDIFS